MSMSKKMKNNHKLHKFLSISNSILEAKSRLNTTYLNLGLREANDTNYEDDALVVDSWIRLWIGNIRQKGISKGTIVTL